MNDNIEEFCYKCKCFGHDIAGKIEMTETIHPERISINKRGELNFEDYEFEERDITNIELLQAYYVTRYAKAYLDNDGIACECIRENFDSFIEGWFRVRLWYTILFFIEYNMQTLKSSQNNNGLGDEIKKLICKYNKYMEQIHNPELMINIEKNNTPDLDSLKKLREKVNYHLNAMPMKMILMGYYATHSYIIPSFKKCCDKTYKRFRDNLGKSCFALTYIDGVVHFNVSGSDSDAKKNDVCEKIEKYINSVWAGKSVKRHINKNPFYALPVSGKTKLISYEDMKAYIKAHSGVDGNIDINRMFSCCEKKFYDLFKDKRNYYIFSAFSACRLCRNMYDNSNVSIKPTSIKKHRDLDEDVVNKMNKLADEVLSCYK